GLGSARGGLAGHASPFALLRFECRWLAHVMRNRAKSQEIPANSPKKPCFNAKLTDATAGYGGHRGPHQSPARGGARASSAALKAERSPRRSPGMAVRNQATPAPLS